jgi:hypothetical protein
MGVVKMDKKETAKNKRLMLNYGITLFDWQDMYENQERVCWICKAMPKNNVLCVDHIHIKGYKKLLPEEKKKYVRALLCFQCNTAFGRLERRKTPRKLLENIIRYFNTFAMKGD